MMELALDFISSILIIISIFYFLGKLIGRKWKLKEIDIVSIFVLGIIQVLLNLYGLNIISTITSIIYIFLMTIKIFKCSIKESRNYSISIWIVSMLIDILVMVFMNSTILVKIHFSNERLAKGIASIIMSFLMLIFANFKALIMFINKMIKKINKINVTMYQIQMIISIFIIISFIGIQSMGNMKISIYILALGIAILLIITGYIAMKYQIYTLKTTNEILEKNNEINMKVITDYRVLKHNLEGQLLGIKTVANRNVKELIDQIIIEYNESFFIKHDINSMPLGINGLVIEKLYNYKDCNIQISVANHIKNDILKSIGPRRYNLFCEALNITLDNALESSNRSDEKLINIIFKENEKYIYLIIKNSYKGKINIEKIGLINYTSKKHGHGLGLYSLIGKNNIVLSTKIKDNIFMNKIQIKKIKSDK